MMDSFGKDDGVRSIEEIQKSIDDLMAKMKALNSPENKEQSSDSGAAAKRKMSEHRMTMTLFAMVISIILSSALLVTTTWAWYTESITAPESSISSAYCTVDTVLDEDGAAVVGAKMGYGTAYSLRAGVEYTVTLTVEGTGNGGYAKLYFGPESGTPRFTQVIPSDNSDSRVQVDCSNVITFKITLENDGDIIFKSCWGDHKMSNPDITDGGTYLYKESTGELVTA